MAPQVVEAIAVAVENGLRLPIVYNTSSYDSLRSLELLDGLVDIYMPDFKVIYINIKKLCHLYAYVMMCISYI